VQILEPTKRDVLVPGTDFSFGDLLEAQALGDFQALESRGRPVIRIADPAELLELM
jgi:hypothetical protein